MHVLNSWSDPVGKLTVHLYKNRYGKKRWFGRIQRRKVTLNTIIGMIAKSHPGISEGLLQLAAGYFQEQMLSLLRMGYAIDMLELGTLYLAPKGAIDGNQPSDVPVMTPRFVASDAVLSTAASVKVELVSEVQTEPLINRIVDTGQKQGDGSSITMHHLVRLTGEHLKLGGDEQGVYLVPEMANGHVSKNEDEWIAVPKENILTNYPKTIEFTVPQVDDTSRRYSIAVRTKLSRSTLLKSAVIGFSEPVSILP